jgi:hypothetical protein
VLHLLRWIAEQADAPGGVSGPAILSRAARELPDSGDLTSLSLEEGGPPATPEEILRGIARRGLRRRMETVNREIRRAEETGNQAELHRFLVERQDLAREQARLAGPALPDAGGEDAGALDPGVQNSGVQDTRVQDPGVQDSGVQDSGGLGAEIGRDAAGELEKRSGQDGPNLD